MTKRLSEHTPITDATLITRCCTHTIRGRPNAHSNVINMTRAPYLMQIRLHQLKDDKDVFEFLLIGWEEDMLNLNNI